MTYDEKLKSLIVKSFARVGKESEETMMSILLDDLRVRRININIVSKAFNRHAETSSFAPTLAAIMKCIDEITEPQKQDELNDFMDRFRKQATNSYAWAKIDDDVYTVKRLIGVTRLHSATEKDFIWIEKQAKEYFEQIQNRSIEIVKNPRNQSIKKIQGSTVRYVESPKRGAELQKIGEFIGGMFNER